MMKLIIKLILAFSVSVSFAQNGYYYRGEKIPLNQVNDRILVTFNNGVPVQEKLMY